MCTGSEATDAAAKPIDREKAYTWEDVRKHCTPDDLWIVLEGKVYDVTEFKRRHPGGWLILEDHAGQDATTSFTLYHMHLDKVRKYMKPLQRGILAEPTFVREHQRTIEADYQELLRTAHKMDLFKPNFWYQFLYMAHIVLLEVAAYQIIAHYGTGWIPFTLAVILLGTSWSHATWHMHDCGHRAITHIANVDHAIGVFFMSFIVGLSTSFWNEFHFKHHSKTNLYLKDPYIGFYDNFAVIGDDMAKKWAKKNAESGKPEMPYRHQHKYWYALAAPFYVPLRYQLGSFMYNINRGKYLELGVMALCLAKNLYLYLPHMSIVSLMLYLWIARLIMTHWVFGITFTNHMPVPQQHDQLDGLTFQEININGTVNLPDTYFHDWFTGGLNWHIEHHLMPHMPRENYRTIAPYVKQFCEKNGLPYRVISVFTAHREIFKMLQNSGQTWYDEYIKTILAA